MINKEEFRKYAIHNQGVSGTAFDQYTQQIENMTRSVIEERPQNFREIDVFSRLIMDRIIFLGTGVDDHIANIIVAQLLFLESVDSKKDVLLYVNSPNCRFYGSCIISGWSCWQAFCFETFQSNDSPAIRRDARKIHRYGDFFKAHTIHA